MPARHLPTRLLFAATVLILLWEVAFRLPGGAFLASGPDGEAAVAAAALPAAAGAGNRPAITPSPLTSLLALPDLLLPRPVRDLLQPSPEAPQVVEAPVRPALPAQTARLELPDLFPWPVEFREIWGYLMTDELAALKPGLPVTDVGLFAAGISQTGRLIQLPDRSSLAAPDCRVHLVLAETGNYALTHFVLDPALPLRRQLVRDLVQASRDYDGLQIDFEAVLTEDKKHFLSFLQELKASLGQRVLSVAIPARTKKTAEAWDYLALGRIVDRVIIMAYDEHWSSSAPGSIASLAWCTKVARYAQKTIPARKLVMGLPLYGRTWPDQRLSRAYRHEGMRRIMGEQGIAAPERHLGIPHFSYRVEVAVEAYYEDARSGLERLALYARRGIGQVAFWRLGQEDPQLWPHVRAGHPTRRP